MKKAPPPTSTAAQATSQSRDRLDEEVSLLEVAAPEHEATEYQSILTGEGNRNPLESSFNFPIKSWKRSCSSLSLVRVALAALIVACLVLLLLLGTNAYPLMHSKVFLMNDEVSEYDYIIVGAGPSGIIVATKLARSFPNLQILLLEAGTESQTAVQINLQHQQHESSKEREGASSTCEPSQQQQQQRWNEFDVPLFWSGVASAQGEPSHRTLTANSMNSRRYPADDLVSRHSSSSRNSNSQQQYRNHHWPVARTLLGKAVGGSGLHNAMVYIRSLSTDWDEWNITGWDFKTHILPEYIQLERILSTNNTVHGAERGSNGPIVTVSSAILQRDAIAPLFLQSAIHAGFAFRRTGFNGDDKHHGRIGVGYYEFNIRHGIRDSVAQAFLGTQQGFPRNLFIETGVTVTRILLAPKQTDDSSASSKFPRAVGVEYVRTSGTSSPITSADRVGQFLLRNDNIGEVILAMGAILTPQILTNSGIGDLLQPATDDDATSAVNTNSRVSPAIQVYLPGVGKNLRDHPVVTMGFEIDAEIALMGGASSIYTIGSDMDEYFWSALELNRIDQQQQEALVNTKNNWSTFPIDPVSADLTQQLGTIGTAGFSAGGFLRSPFADKNDPSPDIQLTVFPRHMEPHVTRQTQQETRDNLWLLRNKAMLVTVALMKPQAGFEIQPSRSPIPLVVFADSDNNNQADLDDRGEDETLKRVLSYKLPEIDLPAGKEQYLTELDVKRLAWGMEQVRRIQATSPLANHTGPEIYPGVHVRGEDLMGYVRDKSLPNSHWAGTCKMGSVANNDAMAVVDERLCVHNVQSLRIVDASVLPGLPNGNIHSTVCVVASRAATLIAEDRNKARHDAFEERQQMRPIMR